MKMALDDVKDRVDENEWIAVEGRFRNVFASMNLCGPRVFTSPKENAKWLYQLFYSYNHLMWSFHDQFKSVLETTQAPRKKKPGQSNQTG